MRQVSKYIDVIRSYLPMDPNAFPQSMHTSASRDTSPEDKIPVSLIDGANFLPTAYGYKSFFGLNQVLEGGQLGLTEGSDPDIVFMYESVAYVNVLIALCRDGIYYKVGNDNSAWIREEAVAAQYQSSDEEFFPWSVAKIDNKIFVYLQSMENYFEISSDANTPCIVTTRTPNFLNMEGQVGIFRAGGRLGFWDTDNSIAWSSIDDFEDFTPSVETLAGSAKFTDVVGTIVTIKAHGPGFMIYSTGSIIYIEKNVQQLFQWDPSVIFNDNGIAYRKQACVGGQDTLHFAYTTKGIYQIQDGKATVVAPEVRDYFREDNSTKFLELLEGRYLCFENLTQVVGSGFVTDGVVPETIIRLPNGNYYPDYDDLTPDGGPAAGSIDVPADDAVDGVPESEGATCSTLVKNNGRFNDQTPSFFGVANPEDWVPSTYYKAVWKAFLSMPRNAGTIFWTSIPCGAVVEATVYDMSPDNSQYLRGVTGDEAYEDGNWTIERFVGIQTALWNIDAGYLEAFRAMAEARTFTHVTHSYSSSPPALNPETNFYCYGTLIAKAYKPTYNFGMSRCAYWLQREATGRDQLVMRKRTVETYSDRNALIPGQVWATFVLGFGVDFQTAGEWVTWFNGQNPGSFPPLFDNGPVHLSAPITTGVTGAMSTPTYGSIAGIIGYNILRGDGSQASYLGQAMRLARGAPEPPGYTYGTHDPITPGLCAFPSSGRYDKSVTVTLTNSLVHYDWGATVETAYVELIGWKYNKTPSGTGFLPKGDSCSAFGDIRRYNDRNGTGPLGGQPQGVSVAPDGSVCGSPFEPIDLPSVPGADPGTGLPGDPGPGGFPPQEVLWPDEEIIVIPGGNFVLRDGTPEPGYPTKYGCFVYDLHLKKWGKFSQPYRLLLDYSPLHSNADGIIPASTFGILGGIVAQDKSINLFDRYPETSYVTWGKIGYNRSGLTSLEEMKVDFREPGIGYLEIKTSLNGRGIAAYTAVSTAFDNVYNVTHYGSYPGKWHIVSVNGIYDISYMEYKGYDQGNR